VAANDPASEHPRASQAPPRGIMPPFRVVPDFLPGAVADALLAHARDREAEFTPTRTGTKQIEREVRISASTRNLGAFRDLLERRIFENLPHWIAQLGLQEMAAATGLETELVAHGDGAFYRRHIDTQTSDYAASERIRVLSGVYYVHATPKAFSGGALRLHAIGSEDFADIEPTHNTMLVFPSWALHEVLPVSVPSRRFSDSRFAVNCWLHKPKASG